MPIQELITFSKELYIEQQNNDDLLQIRIEEAFWRRINCRTIRKKRYRRYVHARKFQKRNILTH